MTKCDCCSNEIHPSRRRLGLVITLRIINGHQSDKTTEFEDLCSEQCLHSVVTDLTRKVEAVHVTEGAG